MTNSIQNQIADIRSLMTKADSTNLEVSKRSLGLLIALGDIFEMALLFGDKSKLVKALVIEFNQDTNINLYKVISKALKLIADYMAQNDCTFEDVKERIFECVTIQDAIKLLTPKKEALTVEKVIESFIKTLVKNEFIKPNDSQTNLVDQTINVLHDFNDNRINTVKVDLEAKIIELQENLKNVG